jgi:hypothetical protein
LRPDLGFETCAGGGAGRSGQAHLMPTAIGTAHASTA